MEHMTSEGEHTIGRWLRDRAAADPHRTAIDDRGVLIDYATLHARSAAFAERLSAAGYGAGARMCTVSGNSVDHVVAFFACALTGITFIPLSWRQTPSELASLMQRSAPDIVLVEDEHAALAEEAGRTLVERGHEPGPWAELGPVGAELSVPDALSPRAVRPPLSDDPLLVIYTSGSEAAPKGVVLTHANCFWNNLALAHAMPMASDDVVLSILPQHHVAAWNIQVLLAWWVGATVVLERAFHPDRVLQLIKERGVTALMGVPTQYRMLLDAAANGTHDFSSVRHAVVGGATIPPELVSAWADRGLHLIQGYGLTEAAPNVLHLSADELREHPGSVGRPYPSVDTCVVDPMSELPLEGPATGELWVRGPSVFPGYLDDPEATARVLRDGWLRTGDLVHRDENGIHRIVDRIKNIYISGGENVAPAEVEFAFAAHPLVAEVGVVGVPDPVWGERGFAFVVASGPLGVDELVTFVRARLAGYKMPVHIEFVEELPRATIEKLARHRLREAALQLLEEQQKTAGSNTRADEPARTPRSEQHNF